MKTGTKLVRKTSRRAFLLFCAFWYMGFGVIRIIMMMDGQVPGVAPWLVVMGGIMLILAGFFALFHLD